MIYTCEDYFESKGISRLEKFNEAEVLLLISNGKKIISIMIYMKYVKNFIHDLYEIIEKYDLNDKYTYNKATFTLKYIESGGFIKFYSFVNTEKYIGVDYIDYYYY